MRRHRHLTLLPHDPVDQRRLGIAAASSLLAWAIGYAFLAVGRQATTAAAFFAITYLGGTLTVLGIGAISASIGLIPALQVFCVTVCLRRLC